MQYCKRTVFFVLIFVMSGLMMFTPGSVASELDDPILEYSYHIKIDLSVIKGLIEQACDPAGFTKSQAEKLTDIRDKLLNSGLGDLKDVTFDFEFTDDRSVGSLDVKFLDSIASKGAFNDFINTPPRGSAIRAAIDEDETLLWLTVMDPATAIAVMHECAKNLVSEGEEPFADMPGMHEMLSEIHQYVGNELHLIITDVEISLMGDPNFRGAMILKMPDGISSDELKKLPEILDNQAVEKLGAKKEMSKWQTMDIVTYSWEGMPGDVQPSYISDKYWFIMATDLETLESIADDVLNPKRTAYSIKVKPPVMNGMFTVNIDKLFGIIPDEAFGAMNMAFGENPHGGNMAEMIKNGDWGIIRLERKHANNGVKIDFTANREVYSLIYHTSVQAMILGMREEIKNEFKAKETQVRSKVRSIRTSLARYEVDNEEYPDDIQKLITDGYLTSFPHNIYTYEPMVDCGFPGSEGDFHYVPLMDEASDKITGYWLIGYGSSENEEDKLNNDSLEKEDVVIQEPDGKVDNVAIVLGS